MEQITAEDARRQFADLLNRVGFQGEQVEITRHGKPIAVLSSASQSLRERLEALVGEELSTAAPGLVNRLADLIDEARIRAKQDAQYRADK